MVGRSSHTKPIRTNPTHTSKLTSTPQPNTTPKTHANTQVVPFLLLAIGVDNMFILSREFDQLSLTHPPSNSNSYSIEELLGHTVAHVGPSILAAATSECLGRWIGWAYYVDVYVGDGGGVA